MNDQRTEIHGSHYEGILMGKNVDDYFQEMNEDYTCRICLESGDRQEFIAPCACKGSSKWVHRACLDQWRITREDRAFSQCTECHQPYKLLSPPSTDTPYHRRKRQVEFLCFVIRDIFIGFVVINLIVVLFALFVGGMDHSSKLLITSFHALTYPKV